MTKKILITGGTGTLGFHLLNIMSRSKGDLISFSEIGSQATLHGRIKNLVAMGYVKLNEDKSDGRKKFVTPTAKAIKKYEHLSSCLEKSLRSS